MKNFEIGTGGFVFFFFKVSNLVFCFIGNILFVGS